MSASYTKRQLIKAVNESTSFKEVALALNLKPLYNTRKSLESKVEKLGIDNSHFISVDKDRWSKEDLQQAVDKAECFTDVLRTLGVLPRGDNHQTVRKHIKKHKINISHLQYKPRRGGVIVADEEVFTQKSKVASAVVKRRYLKLRKDLKCDNCSILPKWNGKPLVLQLDHIDGDSTNNQLINLRLLCPNCHSQTETWGRKSKPV